MIYLVSTAHLKPGTRDKCLAPARAVIAASRQEAGCIAYDLNFSVTDPDRMVFIEVWKDRAALDEHFQTPHFRTWRAAIADFVVSRKLDLITPEKIEQI
jgi:quinol monooxygenase YgiN